MALGAQQRGTVSRATPIRVAQEFARLPRNWPRERWLSANNRYAKNCIEKIRQDTAHGGQLRHGHLASYIAASSTIHCMDGWSYAARAVEAELSGDIDAARHLAYYAELRAAMSILAGAGVGVFHNQHFALRVNGRCAQIVSTGRESTF